MRQIQIGNEKETVVERADYPPERIKAILAEFSGALLGPRHRLGTRPSRFAQSFYNPLQRRATGSG